MRNAPPEIPAPWVLEVPCIKIREGKMVPLWRAKEIIPRRPFFKQTLSRISIAQFRAIESEMVLTAAN